MSYRLNAQVDILNTFQPFKPSVVSTRLSPFDREQKMECFQVYKAFVTGQVGLRYLGADKPMYVERPHIPASKGYNFIMLKHLVISN